MTTPLGQNKNTKPFNFSFIPNDVMTVTVPYMCSKTVMVIESVCKNWKGNQLLLKAKRDLYEDWVCWKQGYPKEIIQMFRINRLSLFKMPILSEGSLPGIINELAPKDLTINGKNVSIVRFSYEGDPALAFLLKGDAKKIRVEGNLADGLGDNPLKEISKMVTFHWHKRTAGLIESLFFGKLIVREYAFVMTRYKGEKRNSQGEFGEGYGRDLEIDRDNLAMRQALRKEISSCLAKNNKEFEFETIENVDNPLPKMTALSPIITTNSVFGYFSNLFQRN